MAKINQWQYRKSSENESERKCESVEAWLKIIEEISASAKMKAYVSQPGENES
jgi:hypothetical protein